MPCSISASQLVSSTRLSPLPPEAPHPGSGKLIPGKSMPRPSPPHTRRPQVVQGKPLRGAELADLITNVVEALNEREIPTAGSLLEYFNKELVGACREVYIKRWVGACREVYIKRWVGACREVYIKRWVGACRQVCIERWVGACRQVCIERWVGACRQVCIERWVGACREVCIERWVGGQECECVSNSAATNRPARMSRLAPYRCDHACKWMGHEIEISDLTSQPEPPLTHFCTLCCRLEQQHLPVDEASFNASAAAAKAAAFDKFERERFGGLLEELRASLQASIDHEYR